VKTGIVATSTVALVAVVRARPLRKSTWLPKMPSAAQPAMPSRSASGIAREPRVRGDIAAKTSAEGTSRSIANAIGGTSRSTTRPTTASVANAT
jgi:hypothetical protein